MDPTGAGRLRGFRAPDHGPDAPPAERPAPARPVEESPGAGAGEELVAGPPPREPWPARRRLLLAAAALAVVLVVVAALAFRLGAASPASTGPASPSPTPTPKATTPAVTDVYRQVVPSVVLITTSKGSLGSGVVVTDTGTILTANHVVSGGGAISVLFADGTKTAATVDQASPRTDTATLLPKKLPEVVVAATLGGGVAVGADVVAIGNPLGLRDSTTTGVVSGLARTTKTKGVSLSGLIQFDAAVNPGSSGGPLLDAQGLVIGIVVSIADPGDDEAFAGIGFAVPIGAALGGGTGSGPGGGPRV